VVHQAIVDLAAKGLVEVVPRKGVFVNDFRATGSCALLTTLLSYREGELDEPFLHSLVDMRLLMETETARLAALYRTEEQVQQFQHILARETRTDRNDARGLADLDFDFHQLVAQASDNLMYLLIINSFEPVYTNITRRFFGKFPSDGVLDQVFAYHRRLVAAIAAGDGDAATAIMAEMLHHGAANLLQDPGGSSHGD
jgi:GntR family transcriptional repressor for pyruvate dehydrogenase complex